MLSAVIIAGFTLGAAGSLHCVGMCGPLGLALPLGSAGGFRRFFSLLLYNLGRVTVYALLGLLSGLIGKSFYLAGFQQEFSVISGVVLLLLALFYILGKRSYKLQFFNGFNRYIVQQASNLISRIKTPAGFYGFGMLNGLLPCGMIYMAIAAALSLESTGESMLFMVFFGMGTMPAMLLFNLTSQLLSIRVRRIFGNISPFLVGLVSVLLILRGLNFNGFIVKHNHDRSGSIQCIK